jgi:hypothetical protein
MFDAITALLGVLNAMTPLGIVALLGVVILLMVHKKGPIQTLKNNHLEHVQQSLNQIAESGDRQVDLLVDISKDMNFLKGKLDK